MDCQSVEADPNAIDCSVASGLLAPAERFAPSDLDAPDGVLPNLAAITNWWNELLGLGIRQMLGITDQSAL